MATTAMAAIVTGAVKRPASEPAIRLPERA